MKNKFLLTLVGLTLTLSMVLGILAGCGGGATPKPTSTTTAPTATTPGATVKPTQTTAAPSPTKAGEVIKWRFQSLTTAGSPRWWLEKEFCEIIKTASGGRLLLEILPVGSILGTYEIFDGVSSGAIEAGGSCDPYWATKDLTFEIQGMIAGHFNSMVQLNWFYYGTNDVRRGVGMRLADELFAKYDIKWIPWSMAVGEAEYMANKPITKASDVKGLTFRGTGWTQAVVQTPEFGAKGVFIPSQDVYSSLQTGVIDACELGNFYSNYAQGYYDICKYSGFPGIHKLCETSSFMVNMKVWNKLPDDLKMIVETSAAYYTLRRMAHENVECAKAIPEAIKKGLTITYSSPELQELWRSTSWMLAEKEAAKNPTFKKMWDEMKAFQFLMDAYYDLQTPNYGPNYPGRKENIKGIKF